MYVVLFETLIVMLWESLFKWNVMYLFIKRQIKKKCNPYERFFTFLEPFLCNSSSFLNIHFSCDYIIILSTSQMVAFYVYLNEVHMLLFLADFAKFCFSWLVIYSLCLYVNGSLMFVLGIGLSIAVAKKRLK